MIDEPDTFYERESRSHRKREMLALQKLGEILVELTEAQLSKIPLDSTLAEAIAHARAITSHEGKRRQLQYIGKLMRHVDPLPIQHALEKLQLKNNLNKSHFHQVERWRDQLIAEGDIVLQKFLQQFPSSDAQRLRQLVRNAQKDAAENKNTGADRALFRYIRTLIENHGK